MRRWQVCLEAGRRLLAQHQTKARFLLAGALNTIMGLAIYPAVYFLAAPLKLHYLVIFAISQVICVTFAFLTNKFLVFRTSGNYLREFWKFISFHLTYFLINLAVLPTLVELGNMNPVWAQMLFAILIIISSYFWHSRITFRSPKVRLASTKTRKSSPKSGRSSSKSGRSSSKSGRSSSKSRRSSSRSRRSSKVAHK